jgi:TRAP-type uncharacterized transport system fused permease subunit
MTTKKFTITLAVSLAVYFISDYFFTDSVLYLLGGAIWGTLENISLGFGIAIGIVLLVGSVVLYFRLRNRPLKYFALFVIAALLYILDFILLELVSFDPDIQGKIILDSTFRSNVFLIFRILYKSLILSLIAYFEQKNKLSISRE